MVASQHLVTQAAELQQQSFSMWTTRLPGVAVTALAAAGALVLLPVMLLTSNLEAQVRASLRQARGVLQKHALTDLLTALPNRRAFELDLTHAVTRADHERERLALLFVDLDGFKPINESFGHAHGDQILREMAARLQTALPSDAAVARLGADQFLVLLHGNPRREDASRRASAMLAAVNAPIHVDGREASISCSIGIAMYPDHGSASALITHADAAMRASKGQGGATYCFFEARMASGAREQVDLLRDLRRALAERQLELYYQPKVHAPSGQITGVEALVRWHHPQRGMISPGVFIPVAERFGLIGALGDWVIEESCRQIGAWRAEGLRMRVSINLSVHQLRQGTLNRHIAMALERHRIQPHLLTVELTESVAMDDAEGTIRTIEALNALGVHISIDDFGTGHSSLSYLRRLNVSELKIDRSFVFDLDTSKDARALVDAIVRLAQALGLKVVAEGVETDAQGAILKTLGCDELQGYLYAKPMSARSLALWAMNNDGPRALDFRQSLFGETAPAPL
jgi:diguanylate cyclase